LALSVSASICKNDISTIPELRDKAHLTWHYRRDPTHVVFFREMTLRHIAQRFGWTCEIPIKDVALMQKSCNTKAMHKEACHAR
jgi:hypothetical protein